MHIDSNSCHKFFIKDFFSKLEQICRFLWICSKLLKYSFTKKSSFSAFYILIFFLYIDILILWVSFYFNVQKNLVAVLCMESSLQLQRSCRTLRKILSHCFWLFCLLSSSFSSMNLFLCVFSFSFALLLSCVFRCVPWSDFSEFRNRYQRLV